MAVVSTTTAAPLSWVSQSAETDRYALVLLNSSGTSVLVDQDPGYALPRVSIPRFRRPAIEITSLLRKAWNVKAVLLWSGRNGPEQGDDYYAVLEAIEDSVQPNGDLEWLAIDDVSSLLAISQASLIHNSRIKALKPCFGADSEPFSRLGWLGRLEGWVNEKTRSSGIEVRNFSQLSGSETFQLIRLETNSHPLWFKAVGAPNSREFTITLLLASLVPDYLPKILAAEPLLNGWLMESGGEETLFDRRDMDTWIGASQRLAELQILCLGRTSELLDAGCRDLRFQILESSINPFFDAMAHLMEQQTKVPPPPVTRRELYDLAGSLRDALRAMLELDGPEGIGHADFNPGNILAGPKQCVFIDWAEAYVGSPFLTFEYLLAHLSNLGPNRAEFEKHLREVYIKTWLSAISEKTIRYALRVSPLIAVYAYAISCTTWTNSNSLIDLRAHGRLRSLTRRMKREANAIS